MQVCFSWVGAKGGFSKRLMGCFQPLPAAVGGLLAGLAKGHQPKLHLLLPRAAHCDGWPWTECDHRLPTVGSPKLAEIRGVGGTFSTAASPCETIPLPSQPETFSLPGRGFSASHPAGASCWKLGNNMIQCSSLLLQRFSDVARNLPCAQTEIPLQRNTTTLSRGDWPSFTKH